MYRPRLCVFAKVPQPGRVKTRLIEALGADGAARLHAALVADRIAGTGREPVDVVLYHHPEDPGPLSELAVELRPQRGDDLGARIAAAIVEQLEEGAEPVVVVGSDSPDLPAARIDQAFDRLTAVDLVLGPAIDGGYYLVGARRDPAELFHGVVWGSDSVLEETIAAARAAGWSFALLDAWYDVDRPSDLRFLRSHLRCLAALGEDRCPHTRAALEELGLP